MSVVSAELTGKRPSLAMEIDEAERLIDQGELGSAAHCLEQLRLRALREGDVQGLRRIAAIADRARELRWRYWITFDTLKNVTEESIRIIERRKRRSVAPEGAGSPAERPPWPLEPWGAAGLEVPLSLAGGAPGALIAIALALAIILDEYIWRPIDSKWRHRQQERGKR